MRFSLAALVVLLVVFLYMCLYANSPDSHAFSAVDPATSEVTLSESIDFEKQVKPIFQSRCQPCHFNGGVMYDRLPFDRPETIKKLGAKLFTRIKDEKEQKVIKQFLEQ